MRSTERPYSEMFEVPNGYCLNHATGVKLPDDFVVTPLQYVDQFGSPGHLPPQSASAASE